VYASNRTNLTQEVRKKREEKNKAGSYFLRVLLVSVENFLEVLI
jgi:hypothetical protein